MTIHCDVVTSIVFPGGREADTVQYCTSVACCGGERWGPHTGVAVVFADLFREARRDDETLLYVARFISVYPHHAPSASLVNSVILEDFFGTMAALNRPSKATYEIHEKVTVDTEGKKVDRMVAAVFRPSGNRVACDCDELGSVVLRRPFGGF